MLMQLQLRKKKKVLLTIGISLVLMLLVSGCGMNTAPITAESPGFFDHYLVYPFSWLLLQTAALFGGSYGLSIIAVTLFIRLMLLPLMIKQSKNMKAMRVVQPKLDELKKQYSGKDQASQQKLQQEMIKLFQAEGVNPIGNGCLPVFIQMPILLAFYYAIMRTEEIARHGFLWFDLGAPDPLYILPILAAVTTFFQVRVTASQTATNNQLAIVNNIMPILILIFALKFPAALSLYWVIGGVFGLVQSYILYAERVPKREVANS